MGDLVVSPNIHPSAHVGVIVDQEEEQEVVNLDFDDCHREIGFLTDDFPRVDLVKIFVHHHIT